MKRRLLAALLAIGLAGSGCYGSFRLTKTIYDWNGSLGNKWLVSIVFWVMVIVPIYELLALGDAIVFNLIEFWSGSNPLGGGGGEAAADDITTLKHESGAVEMKVGDNVFIVRPEREGVLEVYLNGSLAGRANIGLDGSFLLEDFTSRRKVSLSSEDVRLLELELGAPR